MCLYCCQNGCKKALFSNHITDRWGLGSKLNPVMLKHNDPLCQPRYHLSGLIQRIWSYLATTKACSTQYFLLAPTYIQVLRYVFLGYFKMSKNPVYPKSISLITAAPTHFDTEGVPFVHSYPETHGPIYLDVFCYLATTFVTWCSWTLTKPIKRDFSRC